MKVDLRIVETPQTLAQLAAAEFAERAASAVQDNGRFTVALCGGSTPQRLYSQLAEEAQLRQRIPWEHSYFFWGDERPVPPDHPDSNFRLAHAALLSRVPVPAAHVHRMKGELPPQQAAADYARVLIDFFQLRGDALPRFDLVLLGLGPEGHTASLFPGTQALHEPRKLVVANWVGKLGVERITLTAPVLNNAACVIFLVSRAEKAIALKSVLEGRYEPEQLPAQLIRPHTGQLEWIVDAAAARLLTQ